VFCLIMLDELPNFIATFKHNNGMTYLELPPFNWEGIGTVGTTEAMVRFAVLREC
jgi:hypothetical protein